MRTTAMSLNAVTTCSPRTASTASLGSMVYSWLSISESAAGRSGTSTSGRTRPGGPHGGETGTWGGVLAPRAPRRPAAPRPAVCPRRPPAAPPGPPPAGPRRADPRPARARHARVPVDEHPCLGRFDRGGQRVDVVGAIVPPPVDEERRRAGDTAQVGGVDVLGDSGGAGPLSQVVAERTGVEAAVVRVANKVASKQIALVLEKRVVHLPEFSLVGRCFRRLGRELCVRVDVAERQVPPHILNVAVTGKQFPHGGFRPAPLGTFPLPLPHNRYPPPLSPPPAIPPTGHP